MFSLFASKHVKQGRQFVKDARKLLAYKRDLWSAAQIAEFTGGIARLEKACGAGEQGEFEAAAKALDEQCGKYVPPSQDAGWRENSEVFLVAIVVALGVRTYFLQPFTIPTGSMWPTLNGIIGHPTVDEPPNFAVQIFQTAALGRGWVNTVAKEDETIVNIEEVSRFGFFTYTRVQTKRDDLTGGNTYMIHAPLNTLRDYFGLTLRGYQRGEAIVRGYVDTGDHVFVDKFSYHFRTPRRGDVFVFNTQKLPTGERRSAGHEPNNPADFDLPDAALFADRQPPPYSRQVEQFSHGQHSLYDMSKPSQFYIKRLVGTPGDELRVDPPTLFVNGKPAEHRACARVITAEGGYAGYGLGFPSFLLPIFRTAEDRYFVPRQHYFAMGDNSYHSSDSRDWGPVPQQNIMGRGVFVYWPFASHWGLIW